MVGVSPSLVATSAIFTPCTAEMVLAWQSGFLAHCSKRARVSRGEAIPLLHTEDGLRASSVHRGVEAGREGQAELPWPASFRNLANRMVLGTSLQCHRGPYLSSVAI